MRIDIACFTDRGHALGEALARGLVADGDDATVARCGAGLPVRRWTGERFGRVDALVFVGAVGIAVRAVAPHLVSKTSDPAVVVVDDRGRFAVSLLSGHIGGANELAERIARLVGARTVVTTATDGGGVFAVDTWARRNGLAIVNPEKIRAVSAKLLAGKTVGLASAFPLAEPLPDGVVPVEDAPDVRIDIRRHADDGALLLVPAAAILGVGCRRGTSAEAVEAAFVSFCEAIGFFPEAFAKVCSIDLKRDEPGLAAFCERRGLPFETFDAKRLMALAGDFSASDFVMAATGVDTVCERSAVAGGGRLTAGKTVFDGVTMAAAVRDHVVRFDDGDGEPV